MLLQCHCKKKMKTDFFSKHFYDYFSLETSRGPQTNHWRAACGPRAVGCPAWSKPSLLPLHHATVYVDFYEFKIVVWHCMKNTYSPLISMLLRNNFVSQNASDEKYFHPFPLPHFFSPLSFSSFFFHFSATRGGGFFEIKWEETIGNTIIDATQQNKYFPNYEPICFIYKGSSLFSLMA